MMPPVRRLFPALLVALAVAFVGFGVVGVAAAEKEALDIYGFFQLAPRHGGDVGTIQTTETRQFANGRVDTETNSTFGFVWGPEVAWLDARTGVWVAAHEKRFEAQSWERSLGDAGSMTTGMQLSEFVATKDGKTLGHAMDWGGVINQTFGGLIPGQGSIDQGYSARSLWWGEDNPFGTSGACGLDAAVRAGLDLEPFMTLVDECIAPGGGPLRFAVAPSSVEGIATIRFQAILPPKTGMFGDETRTVAIDYNAGIPERIQLETRWSASWSSHVQVNRQRLVGFSSGLEPWDTGLVLPPALALPTIELAPARPWGPDESGFAHPFPASLAWQQARDHATFSGFRDFLASHPSAAASEGRYEEVRDGNRTTRAWRLVVTDGGASYTVNSQQEEGPAGSGVTDYLGLSPPVDAPATVTYDASGQDGGGAPCREPAERMPTLASLAARWQAVTGSQVQANSWSFDCRSFGAGWDITSLSAQRAPDLPEGALLGDSSSESLMLIVNVTGVPTALVRMSRELDVDSSANPGGGPPVGAPGQSSASTIALGNLVWLAPSKPAASGAAAASLLVGLLYWLWPTLKAGAAGLFSRIETPRLLQHPTRRAIADAVEASPGIHYQAIVRLVGGGKGAVDHHLRKLVAAGLLLRHQGAGFTCYFPPKVDRRVTAAAGVLKSEGARRVLAAVQAHPGATSAQLAAVTGLDASTVSHHVHRLAAAGVLQTTKVGRTLLVQPTFLAQQVTAAGAA